MMLDYMQENQENQEIMEETVKEKENIGEDEKLLDTEDINSVDTTEKSETKKRPRANKNKQNAKGTKGNKQRNKQSTQILFEIGLRLKEIEAEKENLLIKQNEILLAQVKELDLLKIMVSDEKFELLKDLLANEKLT
ncbi:MAG: hypothetical protein FWG63_08305 [Defluviitaleaceae bacterium]|nr:hypothetical protein [Defluviitaleaceae bacterium]